MGFRGASEDAPRGSPGAPRLRDNPGTIGRIDDRDRRARSRPYESRARIASGARSSSAARSAGCSPQISCVRSAGMRPCSSAPQAISATAAPASARAPELFAVMRRLGVPVDASIGVAVRGRVGLGRRRRHCARAAGARRHQRLVAHLAAAAAGAAGSAAIAAAWRWRGSSSTRTASPRVFADGTRAEADLLVAADGLHSTVRTQFLPGTRAALRRLRGLARRRRGAPASAGACTS